MKFMIVVLFVGLAAMTMAGKPYYDLKDAEKLFEKFQKDYNKSYKDEQDRQIHFEAFKNSLIQINESNAEQPLATFDINSFADETPEELQQHFGVLIPPNWTPRHTAPYPAKCKIGRLPTSDVCLSTRSYIFYCGTCKWPPPPTHRPFG